MKMNAMGKAVGLFLLLAMLVAAAVSTVSAQGTPVAASSVRGSLNESGSKHYLGLKVLDQDKPVKVVMDYRQDESKLDNGSGFLLFDEQTFKKFIGGDNQANLAVGSLDSSSGLKQKVAIISNPVGTFSIVTYNDTDVPLDYTLSAENALIVDDSGEQVQNATSVAAEMATAESTSEAVTSTGASAGATPAEPATATATPTPAPRVVTTPGVIRAESLQGELPLQFAKHYFELDVNDTNTSVDVTLAFDPQDQPSVDNGFNVYVYTTDQFLALVRGGLTPSNAANTAAGALTTEGGAKVFRATISNPFDTYTVIVANDSEIPVSYTLSVSNGVLVDASGQTHTTQAPTATTNGGQEPVSTETPVAAAPANPNVSAGEIYVIKAGDTIGSIARAAYGDLNLWDELCAYNKLENCDRVEIGQKVTVPAQSELGTGATVAPAAEPTVEPTTTTPPVAETAPVTSTETLTETTTAPPVEATEPTTTTTPVETTTPETTTETPSATAPGTIIYVATDARQFEILLLALSLSNLTGDLQGDGPFTLFAPADAAFASLPETTLDSLLADTAQLARVLQYHVVPQKLTAADITDGMTVDTLMGQPLTFAVSGGVITVNGATVTGAELPASNGSVFTIDAVLLPAQ